MKALGAAAVAVSVAIGAAAPAHCDGPELGTDCISSQLNHTAMSRGGATVRCLADTQMGYTWVIDTGKTQDPWIAGQIAWAACTKTYLDAQCSSLLNGGGGA